MSLIYSGCILLCSQDYIVKLYTKILSAEVFTPEIGLEITANVFVPNSVSVRCPVQQGLVILFPDPHLQILVDI